MIQAAPVTKPVTKQDVAIQPDLDQLCVNTIRTLSMDGVQRAKSGHPGMPMGMADAAYVLWQSYLKHNPADPRWIDRDRFVLSAGHGSMLVYSLLHLTGYDLALDDLRNFRQWGSRTPGHPEFGQTPGVETTTGPLGQGIANAVGMAIAERHLATRFNRDHYPIVDHYTYAIVSDGDMMVGISHEVASLAGHLKLGKLIALYDSNRISIDGSTDLTMTEDVGQRFAAYGWHVQAVDGHTRPEIDEALRRAQEETERPSLIICHTHIGFGSPNKQDSASSHGAPLGDEEVKLTKRALGWPEEPAFYVPDEVYTQMRGAISRGAQQQQEWEDLMQGYRKAFPEQARLWDRMWNKELPPNWDEIMPEFEPSEKGMATRAASGKMLNALSPALPGLISGSADLHNSNMTLINDSGPMQDESFTNRNIFYGVREHGMGSIINGMILHGGLMPYGGTFLIFSDYMRPSLRMSALMGLQAFYVFSHDSIGVGEDGPTHQPVEQVPSLRLIPNLHVVRPADASETAQAWRMALERTKGPTALVLTRQAVPVLTPRENHPKYGPLAPASNALRGGYVLREANNPDVILMASGSEVHLALDAALELEAEGVAARVVSMPCLELFDQQDQEYRDSVLPPSVTARVSVEAAMPSGWERYVGPHGLSVGVHTFGASAPFQEVFQRYGIVAKTVVEAARAVLRPAE